jgi:putative hydrolases of HD superfamily
MVHDLAEALVGDITPYDGVSKEDKRKLEEVP